MERVIVLIDPIYEDLALGGELVHWRIRCLSSFCFLCTEGVLASMNLVLIVCGDTLCPSFGMTACVGTAGWDPVFALSSTIRVCASITVLKLLHRGIRPDDRVAVA